MTRRVFACFSHAVAILLGAMISAWCRAESAPEPAPAPFKLTAGYYRLPNRVAGLDVNLRHTSDVGNVWLGYFRLPDQSVSQWRAGWDHTFGRNVRVTPSLQWATGGFVGGSVQAEIGAPWFVAGGVGRTNLKPYYNLNFDPNDSYLLSVGRRSEDNTLVAVQYIRDNRQNPDQRHLHLLYRHALAGSERITVDTLYKTGLVNGVMIHRWGLSVTYDWPKWFARLAWDPNTNFSTQDALRLSVGARF